MVLLSQQARDRSSRTYMYARRRRRRRLPIGLLLIVAVVVVALVLYINHRNKSKGSGVEELTTEGSESRVGLVEPGDGVNTDPVENDRRADRSGYRNPTNTDRAVLPVNEQPTESRNETPNNGAALPAGLTGVPDEKTDTPVRTITMGEETGSQDSTTSDSTGSTTATDQSNNQTESQQTTPPSYPGEDIHQGRVDADVAIMISQAEGLSDQGKLVEARAEYNAAMYHPEAGSALVLIRRRMSEINDVLLFSSTIVEGDPHAERYKIKSGDMLSTLAPRYRIDWRFLTRINGIRDPSRIREGQTLKVVNGPFHVVINKSEYRMDLYIGQPDAEGRRMYVRSYLVGLGEHGSTPTGEWIVRRNSKLINSPWRNPRTGEYFAADNPNNPIGERWIGIQGVDPQTQHLEGFGIHGTIEPESIGRQASMGCVRMMPDDVEWIYDMLVGGYSSVIIRE